MSKSSFSSHVPWQGSTWLSKAGVVPGRVGTTPQRQPPPLQNPEQFSDDRVTNALHTTQDHLQQTTVISQRRLLKTRCKQFPSKTKAMLPTRPWIQLLKHANGKRRRGVSTSRSARRPRRPRQCSMAPSSTPVGKLKRSRNTSRL